MGQSIEVSTQLIDDIVMFDTDRAITGQDGSSYSSSEEIAAKDFPAEKLNLAWEAEDDIWGSRWAPGDLNDLAKRYAVASHRDRDIQGQMTKGAKADDIAALAAVRAM